MRRFFTILIALLVCVATMNAQQRTRPVQHGKNMEQQTMGMVEALALDDKTAVKFKEVYAKYKKEMQSVQRTFPRGERERKDSAAVRKLLTDAEIEQNIKDGFAKSRAVIDIREKYYKEFRTFLTPRQIQRMYEMEKREMEDLRKRPPMPRDRGPQRPPHPAGVKHQPRK